MRKKDIVRVCGHPCSERANSMSFICIQHKVLPCACVSSFLVKGKSQAIYRIRLVVHEVCYLDISIFDVNSIIICV